MIICGGGSSQREEVEMGRGVGAENTGLDAPAQKVRGKKGTQGKGWEGKRER